MPSRRHDRTHFFKYTTFETAKRVIETKSFRWSAPATFNDPFDHQTGFVIPFKPQEFSKVLFEASDRLIFSDTPLAPDSRLAKMILALRPVRDRLPRAALLDQMRAGSDESAERVCNEGLDILNAMVPPILCHSRVFCVSELYDNVVMWSHYAEQHRGVVFKLRCIDEIDNTLLAARPVIYSHSFPAFPDVDTYVKHVTGERRFDWAERCQDIVYTKHTDWSYEKEWRVYNPMFGRPADQQYDFYGEDPRIFESIYLGCRMDNDRVGEIAKLVRQHLPATKLLRGVKSSTQFALEFAEMPQG